MHSTEAPGAGTFLLWSRSIPVDSRVCIGCRRHLSARGQPGVTHPWSGHLTAWFDRRDVATHSYLRCSLQGRGSAREGAAFAWVPSQAQPPRTTGRSLRNSLQQVRARLEFV